MQHKIMLQCYVNMVGLVRAGPMLFMHMKRMTSLGCTCCNKECVDVNRMLRRLCWRLPKALLSIPFKANALNSILHSLRMESEHLKGCSL